jgi:hypothetical protein
MMTLDKVALRSLWFANKNSCFRTLSDSSIPWSSVGKFKHWCYYILPSRILFSLDSSKDGGVNYSPMKCKIPRVFQLSPRNNLRMVSSVSLGFITKKYSSNSLIARCFSSFEDWLMSSRNSNIILSCVIFFCYAFISRVNTLSASVFLPWFAPPIIISSPPVYALVSWALLLLFWPPAPPLLWL